jgi:hypothetical protein
MTNEHTPLTPKEIRAELVKRINRLSKAQTEASKYASAEPLPNWITPVGLPPEALATYEEYIAAEKSLKEFRFQYPGY